MSLQNITFQCLAHMLYVLEIAVSKVGPDWYLHGVPCLRANTATEPWHVSRQLHIIYNSVFKGTIRNVAENWQNYCLVFGKYCVEVCVRRLDALTVVLRRHLRATWEVLWPHYCVLLYINKIQQDATVCRYLFAAKSLYIFRVSIAPIIRST